MSDSLIRNLRDLAAFAHADLSVADEAADEIERLHEALRCIADYHPAVTHGWAENVRAIARAALGEQRTFEDRWDNA